MSADAFSDLVTSNRYRVGAGIGDRYFTADVADGVTAAERRLGGQNHFTATHGTPCRKRPVSFP